jgi:hypothetical protein
MKEGGFAGVYKCSRIWIDGRRGLPVRETQGRAMRRRESYIHHKTREKESDRKDTKS